MPRRRENPFEKVTGDGGVPTTPAPIPRQTTPAPRVTPGPGVPTAQPRTQQTNSPFGGRGTGAAEPAAPMGTWAERINEVGGGIAGGVGDTLFGKDYDPASRPEDFQLEGAAGLATQYGDIAGLGTSYAPQIRDLAGSLGDVASGQQAGAGELAVQRQASRAIAAQNAMAQTPGFNQVSAGRNAARNIAQMGVDTAGQVERAATTDQARAQALQAQILAGQQQAQLDAVRGQTGLSQAELQARLARESMLASAAAADQGIAGGLISAGSQLGAARMGMM